MRWLSELEVVLGRRDAVLATIGGCHCIDDMDGMVDAGVVAGAWRGVASVLVVDEGGRCGCIAGEAFTGVDAVVMGLRVGDITFATALCCSACC